MMTLHVRLYNRPACEFCDQALELLESLRGDFDFLLEELNIEDDPGLKDRLGEQVPVVTVDGGNRVSMPITEERVRRALTRALKNRQEPIS